MEHVGTQDREQQSISPLCGGEEGNPGITRGWTKKGNQSVLLGSQEDYIYKLMPYTTGYFLNYREGMCET